MYPDQIALRIREISGEKLLRQLALFVMVSRLSDGCRILDATDFQRWLIELANEIRIDEFTQISS